MNIPTHLSLVLALTAGCTATQHDEDAKVTSSSLAEVRGSIAEKDIAILFDKNKGDLISATSVFNGEQLLSETWYAATLRAFGGDYKIKESHAAGVTESQNTRSEWMNVSTRVEPCAPLGVAPFQRPSALCWPEVRLVLQPLTADFRGFKSFASDRGIHLLYDVNGDTALTAEEQADIGSLKAKVADAVASGSWTPESEGPLSAAEEARFVSARNKVARLLVEDARALRDPNQADEAYRSIAFRPELASSDSRLGFMSRYTDFLTKYVFSTSIKQVAAMSFSSTFPVWKGTFVSLRPQMGKLVREPLDIISPSSGKKLLGAAKATSDIDVGDGTFNASATTIVDEQLKIANGGGAQSPADDATRAELRQISLAPAVPGPSPGRILVSPRGDTALYATIKARIEDRSQILVPNSSCGSCHALQQDRAFGPTAALEDASNFHNLSYFSIDGAGIKPSTERGLSPSPRVMKDVAFDLAWIDSEL